VKALRLSPGQLLLQARLCGEELDAIAVESSHTIDIDCFVPKSEIDERYVDGPYYLVPENKVTLEAFAVIPRGRARHSRVSAMAGLADDLMTARRNRPPQGTLSASRRLAACATADHQFKRLDLI
jgi:non-homologous end joining protein Ku